MVPTYCWGAPGRTEDYVWKPTMKLLLENWREFVKQEIEEFLPHGEVRAVERIGSSTLSPEDKVEQDLEKYGYVRDDDERDFDIEVQIAGVSNEDVEEWAFSEEAEELENSYNYDIQLTIVENWRKFVNEEIEPITTLRIFDFDETIAHTRSETRVKAPDGSETTLSDQKEFEEYMRAAAASEGIETFDPVRDLQELGYQIDLSDFSIVKDPDEITVVTDIMRNFPEDSKTYIVTARRGNSIGPILDYLDDIGINSGQVRPIATQGESKGDVLVKMMENKIMDDGKSNIHRIEYYEDSQRNIDDVLNKVCDSKRLDQIKPEDFVLVVNKVIKIDDGYKLEQISC